MSLIFMFFYWVIFPAGIVLGTWWLFIRANTLALKGMAVLAGVAVFAGYLWVAVGERWMVDQRVKDLCAKDGGIKVYEKIILPSKMFNEWGVVNFYHSSEGENALGKDYMFKQNIHYYKKDEPSLYRYRVQIFSRENKKILGESIGYYRGGGDLPGPWHSTSFSCSEIHGEIPLLKSIFVKSGG